MGVSWLRFPSDGVQRSDEPGRQGVCCGAQLGGKSLQVTAGDF